jgi:hypothetical protein
LNESSPLKVKFNFLAKRSGDNMDTVTITKENYNRLIATELYMQALENTGALDVLDSMLDIVNEEYKQLKLDWENGQNGN